jgi:hypothetical protein
MSTTEQPSTEHPPTEQPSTEQETQEMRLVDVVIENENVALNVLVSFVNVAQKRGAFSIDESAKIWDCIQKFMVKPTVQSETINITDSA